MSPNIRVDQEVWEYLQRRAQPFVDTPNTVLRRLLSIDLAAQDGAHPTVPSRASSGTRTKQTTRTGHRKPGGRGGTRPSTRPSPGSLLPEDEYVRPLLEALASAGGSLPAREVIQAVGAQLSERLTAVDKEPIRSGAIRWQNRVQFVRLRLVEQGLLAKDAPRGFWALTDAGRSSVNEPA